MRAHAASAMSLGPRPLACLIFWLALWAGAGSASAATWQDHRDAGLLAYANADYGAAAERLEMALSGSAEDGHVGPRDRGVMLEKLATAYLATRWFGRARGAIARWDEVLETAPGEPWAFQQRSDRDRLALVVSEVIGEPEMATAPPAVVAPAPIQAPAQAGMDLAVEDAVATLAETEDGPPFESLADVPFAPDVALPAGEAAGSPAPEVLAAAAPLDPPTPMPWQPAPGGYALHLISLTDEAAVPGSWAKLQESFPDLLAGMDLAVRQADLGDRGVFYRIHAVGFAGPGEAESLCEAFRALDQYCAVVNLQ